MTNRDLVGVDLTPPPAPWQFADPESFHIDADAMFVRPGEGFAPSIVVARSPGRSSIELSIGDAFVAGEGTRVLDKSVGEGFALQLVDREAENGAILRIADALVTVSSRGESATDVHLRLMCLPAQFGEVIDAFEDLVGSVAPSATDG